MALFNFGKKKEEQKTPACACNGGCPASEAESMTHSCCGEAVDGICCIRDVRLATSFTKTQKQL